MKLWRGIIYGLLLEAAWVVVYYLAGVSVRDIAIIMAVIFLLSLLLLVGMEFYYRRKT